MIAPTEKHLEDWIVNNQRAFFDQLWIAGRRIVSRQFRLSNGIADLIVAVPIGIRVIELKKGQIDGAAVTQVMRYVGELRTVYDYMAGNIHDANDPHAHEYRADIVRGMVIGRSFEKAALLTCGTCGIAAFEYDYDGINYTFKSVFNDNSSIVADIESSPVGYAIREAMRHTRLREDDFDALVAIYKSEGTLK